MQHIAIAVLRAQDAIAPGLSWRDVYELRDGGVVVLLPRGVDQLAEAFEDASWVLIRR